MSQGWRRVHHRWYFWVGVFLMMVAIGTYVMTEDLAWRPRGHPPQNAVRVAIGRDVGDGEGVGGE